MNSLLRHLNVLNMLIIAAIILLAVLAQVPPSDRTVDVGPTGGGPRLPEVPGEAAAARVPPFDDFSVVAEKNVFHPERRPVVKEAKKEKEPERTHPKFVLYGTLISGDNRVAYMQDAKKPHSTPGRGIRQRALRINDTLSGYTVQSIEHDKVVMVSDDSSVEVRVLDPDKPRSASVAPNVKKRMAAPGAIARRPLPKSKELLKKLKRRQRR